MANDLDQPMVYQIRIKGHLGRPSRRTHVAVAPRLAGHSDAALQRLGKKSG